MNLEILLKENISEEELIQLIDEGKITSLSRRDIISHIKEKGWVFDREGKHTIYKHPDAKHIVEVPRHNVLEIGTAKQIIAKSDPNWKDPKRQLNNSYIESNKKRIIQETIKNALEKQKKKKEDLDKFVANPDLKSEIMKES